MPDNLTFYYRHGSGSMPVHIALHELGIPFRAVLMQPSSQGSVESGYEAADGSFTHEEYIRDINAMGYVPALSVANGTSETTAVITEVPAIMSFLAGLVPERKFLGSTNLELAKCVEWMTWLSGTVSGIALVSLWRPDRLVDQPTTEITEALRLKGQATALRCLQIIESALKKNSATSRRSFAVGDRVTAVDIYLHTFWRWCNQLDIDMEQSFPRFTESARCTEEMESVRTVMRLEGQEFSFLGSR